jgi:hypothetical protein
MSVQATGNSKTAVERKKGNKGGKEPLEGSAPETLGPGALMKVRD